MSNDISDIPVIRCRADLTRAEEKAIEQVLETWIREQPVCTSLHPGSRYALHPAEAKRMFWRTLFEGWDTSSEPKWPTLKPATFEETASLIGLVRDNVGDREADPSLPAPGANAYCQPVVDRRIGAVKFILRTKPGYRLQYHNINFYLDQLDTPDAYLRDSMLNRDENERIRITTHNMELAVAISRTRLRYSVRFGRRVPARDLALLKVAEGFRHMNLARLMHNDYMMRHELRMLANANDLVQSLEWNIKQDDE